jgi:predicted ATPase
VDADVAGAGIRGIVPAAGQCVTGLPGMGLLERDAGWQALDRALREASQGPGRVAMVSGEASIGKTTMVERFVRERRATLRLPWGACGAFVTPRPLGPLHDTAGETQGPLRVLLTTSADRAAIFGAILAELQPVPWQSGRTHGGAT